MFKWIFLVVVIMVIHQIQSETYTTKWDSTDIDDILKNERLLNNYVKCLMDEGPCTPDATELKRVLKEALQTDCEKCSEKQKENSMKVIQYLINEKPKVWNQLEAKHDPDGTYRTKYADRLTPIEKPAK